MFDNASNHVITQAIHSGKLSAQDRAHYARLLAKDFGSTLKEIEEMPGRKEILSQLKRGRSTDGQDQSQWMLNDYRKQAPQELRKDPELYLELIEKQQNTKA